jgi:hypothetical protein
MSQQRVADIMTRPQSFVAKAERGSRRIDPVEWVELLQAMGADPVKEIKGLMKR